MHRPKTVNETAALVHMVGCFVGYLLSLQESHENNQEGIQAPWEPTSDLDQQRKARKAYSRSALQGQDSQNQEIPSKIRK